MPVDILDFRIAVIVHGIGGIGKTALVSHVATRLREHFKGVFAFDCTSGTLAPETAMLVPWVLGIYYGLSVLKTELININLRSPTDIREKAASLLETKQHYLDIAFVLLIVGVVLAFGFIVFRLQI